jgi:hypothetical protein
LAIVAVALLATLLVAASAVAVPPLPFNSYGTVTIDGEDVPAGTPVRAWCAGVQYGSTETSFYEGQSVYAIDVRGDDLDQPGTDGCYAGETVTYTVDGLTADQSATWVSGSQVEVNLTAFRPEAQIFLQKQTLGMDADVPLPRSSSPMINCRRSLVLGQRWGRGWP